MKRFLFPVLILGSLGLAAQDKTAAIAPVVSETKQFALKTGMDFLSYSNGQNDFMLAGRMENTEKIYALVMTDDADEIITVSNIRVATEVGDNHFRLAGLALAGSNLTAFVESHNRQTGRNVMAMQAVDKNGGLTSEGMLVGYFDFLKEGNPGLWHISSSPDQKKIALIAQLPYEPGKPERLKYFFMDENLTMLNTGEFSISSPDAKAPVYKGLQISDFLVSDKGELYLIAKGSAESHQFPLVYKGIVGSDQCSALGLGASDGSYESGGYKGKIRSDGTLILAGYFQKKGHGTDHGGLVSGSWNFSETGKKIKFNSFDMSDPGLRAESLVLGTDSYYLIGCSPAGIHVTGFDIEGLKKFDLPVARNLMAGMSMHDHAASVPKPEEGIACGVLDDQLKLFYNDLAGKYKPDATGLVTVGLYVNKEGVTSSPVTFGGLNSDGAMVLPQFFSANADHIRILAATENAVKVITFR